MRSSGAAVSCLGHAHPDVLAAMHAQLDKLAYAHTSFFTTQAAEELADELIAHAPHGIGHVFFVSGGSEAIEAALKMARQYFVERGEPQRRYVIARRQSYHGDHAGRARGRRPRMAAQAVRAAADRGASCLAGLRISRPARGRDAASLWRRVWREELEAKIRRARRRERHRLRRRDGGRRHLGRRPGGARLFQARARNLRPPRHPADPRRGDVRHGPHRHAARLRAGGD